MSTRRIVLGVDGSHGAVRALDWCIQIAKDLGAEIVAVHVLDMPAYAVVPPMVAAGPYLDEAGRDELRAIFEDEWCKPLADAGVAYRTAMVEGNPANAIIAVADREDADMIVAGARGRGGFAELLLGSVGHQLTHHARRPVVIVPAALS